MKKKLIQDGADPNAKNIWARIALHNDACSGDLELVQDFLAKGSHVNVKNKHDVTLLHKATESKSVKMVKLLNEGGAGPDINGKIIQVRRHWIMRKTLKDRIYLII
jgi:ankyrin repeat protein